MRAVIGSSAEVRRLLVRSGAASMVWAAFKALIRSASSGTPGSAPSLVLVLLRKVRP